MMLDLEKKSAPYLICRSILKDLRTKGLITEQEFNLIDVKNRQSFM